MAALAGSRSGSGCVIADQETRPETAEQGAWARPVSARIGEALTALALVAAAVFFIWQSALLDFGRVGLPGPGFFPFALGIALGLLASAILYLTWRGTTAVEAVHFGHRDILVVFAALVGVAIGFEVDAYLTLGPFTAVLLLLIARTALWRAVLDASLGMVAVWAVFKLGLGVRLPASAIWDQLTDLVAAKLPASPF